MRFRTRNILKKASLILLGIGIIGAVGIGTKKLVQYVKNDTSTLHLDYEVGSLNETDGKYLPSDVNLYTKKAFACEGLRVSFDFDTIVNGQFYFYDINDKFISKTDVITEGASVDIPLNGAYARAVILTNDEDGKISFTEKYKYASQMQVKVNKKAEANINKRFTCINDNTLEIVDDFANVRFENKVRFLLNDNRLVYSHDNDWSCTSKCLINVGKNKKINFQKGDNFNDLDVQFSVIEFSGSIGQLVPHQYSTQTQATEWELNSTTSYVLVSVCTSSQETSFTDTQIQLMNKLFTFSK